MAMDSSTLILRQDAHLSSIRTRNKILILTFFSLIFVLALITGGIIISFIQKLNSDTLKSNRALQQFCTPFGELSDSCITLLTSEIKPPSNANPNHIFILSLEISLKKLSTIISILSDSEGICSSSLIHATGQLRKTLDTVRVDPDVETYQRGNMTAWVAAAGNDLTACVRDLSTAAEKVRVRTMVDEARAVVMYGRDFLRNSEIVNNSFSYGGERNPWEEAVENLLTVSLFGSQYFVLLFLFCLLLRFYYKV